ncbi:hypothetical protein V1951_21260 [Yersinia sp. 2544 StPb PI]|uniref:hypothetical protein n=1 Tax=unclassified Yersinia (in: enterobacteria) TaxID=2653513 RepID=UPI000E65ACF8|nr:hypothetical protein D3Z09_09380 [Rahnella aquatilis]
MEQGSSGVQPDDEALSHELIAIQAFADARLKIVFEFGDTLPVDEIVIGPITQGDAVEVSNSWRTSPKRDWIKFNWWKARHIQTKRIDVSIRCRDFLCGLMLARRSRRQICVTLRYLEGNPDPNHPLKGYVLPIATLIAESFASQYGIATVCISRPEKGLIAQYASRGYQFNATDTSRVKRHNKPRAKLMSKMLS